MAEREIPAAESLHPPSMQSPSQLSPSIYQTDDQQEQQLQNNNQQNWKRDKHDEQSIPSRKKEFTVAVLGNGSASIVDLNGNPVQSRDDNSDNQRELTRSDLKVIIRDDDDDENDSSTQPPQEPATEGEVTYYNEETDGIEDDYSLEGKKNRWTTASADDDIVSDDGNSGYQLLTCRVTNNFYTNFRW